MTSTSRFSRSARRWYNPASRVSLCSQSTSMARYRCCRSSPSHPAMRTSSANHRWWQCSFDAGRQTRGATSANNARSTENSNLRASMTSPISSGRPTRRHNASSAYTSPYVQASTTPMPVSPAASSSGEQRLRMLRASRRSRSVAFGSSARPQLYRMRTRERFLVGSQTFSAICRWWSLEPSARFWLDWRRYMYPMIPAVHSSYNTKLTNPCIYCF